jgi:hypothetical protein
LAGAAHTADGDSVEYIAENEADPALHHTLDTNKAKIALRGIRTQKT